MPITNVCNIDLDVSPLGWYCTPMAPLARGITPDCPQQMARHRNNHQDSFFVHNDRGPHTKMLAEQSVRHRTTGTYAGFDRFGRIVKQHWRDYGGSSDLFDVRHGYDRASNRLYADRQLYRGSAHAYTYDNQGPTMRLIRTR